MEDGKRKPDAEASSSTIWKRQRPSDERGSGSPLPDSPEKIDVPSDSEENSGPSASYADVIGNNYYVFLSFRGLDTRKGFVDHLYHELVRVGLHLPNFVFRDDENLDPGEPIEMLLNAIKCSKVSIPVISENYATSKWCLREINQIMESVKSKKQKVYPVFYKVTTDDVKYMTGHFGDAFRQNERILTKRSSEKGW
ncbi:toll/interleukin-1 receptor-like protein [Eucalyptus grandis]|uniref:toll/interleukin-1 receptor-like protein n=1 Tax=Eucalyptus grandis TaxID=71139 RepID=UPI00192E7DF8|nr:toll/interleukin-1 receptor-like protein [Eucalyptus grandis]